MLILEEKEKDRKRKRDFKTCLKSCPPIGNAFSSLTLSAHYVNNVFSQLRLDTFNSMNIMNFKCEGGVKERERERERKRERDFG